MDLEGPEGRISEKDEYNGVNWSTEYINSEGPVEEPSEGRHQEKDL
jgi:hypothetical protein